MQDLLKDSKIITKEFKEFLNGKFNQLSQYDIDTSSVIEHEDFGFSHPRTDIYFQDILEMGNDWIVEIDEYNENHLKLRNVKVSYTVESAQYCKGEPEEYGREDLSVNDYETDEGVTSVFYINASLDKLPSNIVNYIKESGRFKA
jgi:hypothetical protein